MGYERTCTRPTATISRSRRLPRLRLGQISDAIHYVGYGALRYLIALTARHDFVAAHMRLERLRLLQAERHLFHHLAIAAPDQDANFVKPRQVVRYGVEAAHKEVADRNIGACRAAEHLFQAGEQVGVSVGVEDVHGVMRWGGSYSPLTFLGLIARTLSYMPRRDTDSCRRLAVGASWVSQNFHDDFPTHALARLRS